MWTFRGLDACISKKLPRWRFSQSDGPGELSASFEFTEAACEMPSEEVCLERSRRLD